MGFQDYKATQGAQETGFLRESKQKEKKIKKKRKQKKLREKSIALLAWTPLHLFISTSAVFMKSAVFAVGLINHRHRRPHRKFAAPL